MIFGETVVVQMPDTGRAHTYQVLAESFEKVFRQYDCVFRVSIGVPTRSKTKRLYPVIMDGALHSWAIAILIRREVVEDSVGNRLLRPP